MMSTLMFWIPPPYAEIHSVCQCDDTEGFDTRDVPNGIQSTCSSHTILVTHSRARRQIQSRCVLRPGGVLVQLGTTRRFPHLCHEKRKAKKAGGTIVRLHVASVRGTTAARPQTEDHTLQHELNVQGISGFYPFNCWGLICYQFLARPPPYVRPVSPSSSHRIFFSCSKNLGPLTS
jgi:hypothetical protein